MNRILVAPFLHAGHVHPHLAVAQAPRERGHTVYVYAEAGAAEEIRRAGCVPLRMPAGEALRTAQTPKHGVPLRHILRVYSELAQRVAPHLLRLLEREKIDAVLTDAMHLGAALAAERSGLPWTTLVTGPVVLTLSEHTLFARLPTRALRKRLGLPPTEAHGLAQGLSPRRVLLPWLPEFDVEAPPPQAVHIGNLSWEGPGQVGPAWVKRLDPKVPTVLVSTSSMSSEPHHRERYLSAAAEALNALPVQGIITVGAGAVPRGLRLRRHVRLERFVPHGVLRPHLRALVSHGGWGLISRALVWGTPVVVVPAYFDQPMNGALCELNQIGSAIPHAELTGALLEERLRRLLEPGSLERQSVRAFSERLRDLRPGEQASRWVLEAPQAAEDGVSSTSPRSRGSPSTKR